MAAKIKILLTTSPGLEPLLADELRELGIAIAAPEKGKIFSASVSLEEFAKVRLWSRLVSRVLIEVGEFHAWEKESLYREAMRVEWEGFFRKGDTFSMDSSGTTDDCDYSPVQGMLKIKDAICDRLREHQGERPNIEKENPTRKIFAHFYKGHASLSVDLDGEPLHRRGYRPMAGTAPLRESRAAALVRMASSAFCNTPSADLAEGEGTQKASSTFSDVPATFLQDPFCGSGTIVIEAAMMLRKIPPAFLRRPPVWPANYDFQWKAREMVKDAMAASLPEVPMKIVASDIDSKVLRIASRAAQAAGVQQDIEFKQADVCDREFGPGTIITNPPYGERLQDREESARLLKDFGHQLKFKSEISTLVLLCEKEQIAQLGFKPKFKYAWKAGPLELTAAKFELYR